MTFIQQKEKKSKYMLFIDLKKAYDSVDRAKLIQILRERVTSEVEKHLVEIMVLLLQTNNIDFHGETIRCNTGVPQGGVLSPLWFNVYLEGVLSLNNNSHIW